MNFSRTLTAYGLTALLAAFPSFGQSSQSEAATTIAVDVKVVTLPVSVRDKRGQIVRNLTANDFVLHDNGQAQTIRYFSQDSNLPLTLGLLVDTSLSQRNVLDQESNASRTFLDQMLTNQKDKAFVIHFDHEVELLQDLTSSRSQLQSALDLLQTPRLDRSSSQAGGSQPDARDSPRSHGGGAGTLLYDAVYLGSTELMQKQAGRKAMIILSDGVDRGSKESLESAIAAAQHADTVVYSILFADEHQGEHGFDHSRAGGSWPGGGGSWPGGGGGGGRGGHGGGRGRPSEEQHVDGKKILERISKETGGRLYAVSKKEGVGQIYDSIAEELRTQYSLGYTPTKDDSAAGYHRITLEPRNKDLTVQTRDGYFADR